MVQKNGHGAEVQTLVFEQGVHTGHISVRSPEAKVFSSHHCTHCMENTENIVLLQYYEPKPAEKAFMCDQYTGFLIIF